MEQGGRKLRWKGRVVLKLGRPAPHMEAILDACERQRWQGKVADPLPPLGPMLQKKAHVRLHDALKRLNRLLKGTELRFHDDGTGESLWWTAVKERSRISPR